MAIDIDKLINNRILIVILGPTASGKTELSIQLSENLPIEIISADSRQIYRYLDIGTAKPTKEELSKVKHHFIDILNPDEDYNAGRFGNDAELKCNEIYKNGKLPVIVGGSGLYIKSLCEGLFTEEINIDKNQFREKLQKQFDDYGIDGLYTELKEFDKISAEKYSDKNPRRIIRALEHYYSFKEPFSTAHEKKLIKRNFNVLYFGILFERKKLYDRINLRTEQMWYAGLPVEYSKVISMGYSKDLNSLNSVGYKECASYYKGKFTKDLALEEIKKNTRRYAKRQMTWFNRNEEINWLMYNTDKNIEFILNLVKKFVIPGSLGIS